jgi:hypothetical protein
MFRDCRRSPVGAEIRDRSLPTGARDSLSALSQNGGWIRRLLSNKHVSKKGLKGMESGKLHSCGTIFLLCAVLPGCGYTYNSATLTPPFGGPDVSEALELFAEGTLSTGDNEFSVAFTPDGRVAYTSVSGPDRVRHPLVILKSEFRDDRWQTPEVAPFSGIYSDADPFVSSDGARLFFMSRRPMAGNRQRDDFDIWVVDQTPDGWGIAQRLDSAVNTDGSELFPSVTTAGDLYFTATYADPVSGEERLGIHRSEFAGGEYIARENFSERINPGYDESNVYVAPDERFVVFSSARPDGYGDADLYISFNRSGSWSTPQNLGTQVNSELDDYAPAFSPNGRFFFFASRRIRFGDISPDSRLDYAGLLARIRGPGNGGGNADIYYIQWNTLGL